MGHFSITSNFPIFHIDFEIVARGARCISVHAPLRNTLRALLHLRKSRYPTGVPDGTPDLPAPDE